MRDLSVVHHSTMTMKTTDLCFTTDPDPRNLQVISSLKMTKGQILCSMEIDLVISRNPQSGRPRRSRSEWDQFIANVLLPDTHLWTTSHRSAVTINLVDLGPICGAFFWYLRSVCSKRNRAFNFHDILGKIKFRVNATRIAGGYHLGTA